MNDEYTRITNPEYYYSKAKSKTDWNMGDLKYLVDFIKKGHLEGRIRKVLEVGCGTAEAVGILPPELHYTGIDPIEYSIKEAKQNHQGGEFLVAQAQNLPFNDNSFDVVFSHQVLEMLFEPKDGLKEMMRVVRPGGHVAIIAPNLEAPWSEVHAVRHYSFFKHLIFTIKRWTDLFLRSIGILRFRVIPQSHTQATGKFEKSDDDLKYITSAYELSRFFRRHNFAEVYAKKYHYNGHVSLKNTLRKLLVKIPAFRYYGGGIFFIFQKQDK